MKHHFLAFPRPIHAVFVFVLATIFKVRRFCNYGPNTNKRAVLKIKNDEILVQEITIGAFTFEIYISGDAVRETVSLDDFV